MIFTDSGIKGIDQVAVGDYIIDNQGQKVKVASIDKRTKPCYKVLLGDKVEAIVNDDYTFFLMRNDRKVLPRQKDKNGKVYRPVQTFTTREQLTPSQILKAVNEWKPKTKRLVYRIEPVKIEFSEKNNTLDPYILGLLLGDGCISKKIGSPRFTGIDMDIIKTIEQYAEKIGDEFKFVNGSNCDYSFIHGNMKEICENIGIWGHTSYNKFIPESYICSSEKCRLEVARGLMDTDGSVYKKSGRNNPYKSYEYDSVSKKLAQGLQKIFTSLGCFCNMFHIKDKTYKDANGKIKKASDVYRLDIRAPKNMSLFNCIRKKNKEKELTLLNGNERDTTRKILSIKNAGKRLSYTFRDSKGRAISYYLI